MNITVDRNRALPIKKQLYDALTEGILSGALACGQQLPSSRRLAEELGIARNTVVEIYEQLIAEAYLETHQGSGTYVASMARQAAAGPRTSPVVQPAPQPAGDILSLIAGTPDLGSFPQRAWQNACRSAAYRPPDELYGYGNPFGYRPLRQALAQYLNTHKGIQCDYRQVLITAGTKDALHLLALSLAGTFTAVITESPCIHFTPVIFTACGYAVHPVPVDAEGLQVEFLPPDAPPSLVYTSPAHQFPIGGTLSLGRRERLVEFARMGGHLVIEDDYDSEFRYRGAPVNSLFRLGSDVTVHMGTFSKTLAPSLRLGYMVLPKKVLETVRACQYDTGNPPPTFNQAVLAEMIANGSYEKHLYRMNRLYKNKMAAMVEALRAAFGESVTINGIHSGLHVSVHFQDVPFAAPHRRFFADNQVAVNLLNDYAANREDAPCTALVLGFGHLQLTEIREAVTRLKRAVEQIKRFEGE